jgi:hypothetical protein
MNLLRLISFKAEQGNIVWGSAEVLRNQRGSGLKLHNPTYTESRIQCPRLYLKLYNSTAVSYRLRLPLQSTALVFETLHSSPLL